jgi:hypothetical protein
MLDFYFISYEQEKPSSKELKNFELAGSVSEEDFEYFKSIKIIESRFDYYKDFRWNSVFISQKTKKLIGEKLVLDNRINQFLKILNTALDKKKGLLAFSD